MEGKLQHPHQDRARRALTAAQGQHPLAAVLTCSDSRVPAEIIFDQGIGDIFVIRVAGNVAATDEIGSIEYAVDHLAAPAGGGPGAHPVRRGHRGAWTTPSCPPTSPTWWRPSNRRWTRPGRPIPEAAKDVLLKAAITDNVWQAMEDMLRQSPIIREKVRDGQAQVVGALYDLDSGQVQWLGPHPDQEKLVGAKKGRRVNPARRGKSLRSPRSNKVLGSRRSGDPSWRSPLVPKLHVGTRLIASNSG